MAEYRVSPTGTAGGNGTEGSPWDLATALAHPVSVLPGDTIELQGGTYTGTFISSLTGSQASPIVVCNCENEQAVIDGSFTANGSDTHYKDLEFMLSDPQRVSAQAGSTPTDMTREGKVVQIFGPRTKVINCIIHDQGGSGVGFWNPAVDAELYGNLIFNCGWEGTDRGHGHGIYVQNSAGGTKRMVDNIVFNQFGFGFHGYNSGDLPVYNLFVEGNVSFGNGTLSKLRTHEHNYAIGEANNMTFRSNYSYDPLMNAMPNQLATGGHTNLIVEDNYLVGGPWTLKIAGGGIEVPFTAPASFDGNFSSGYVTGLGANARITYPANTYWWNVKPPTVVNAIFVRPNAYEVGRAHIIVYNWQNLDRVTVDLSTIGLVDDQVYEIFDAQNFRGPAVAGGIYSATDPTCIIPMGQQAIQQPIGAYPVAAVHTPREFGVFIVRAVATAIIVPFPHPELKKITTAAQIPGGIKRTGTILLGGPAPEGGTPVTLSSDNACLTVPASVTVPAGLTKATFDITTSAVAVATDVIITARLGVIAKTAETEVQPPLIASINVPPSVVGGASVTGRVALNVPAPAGGVVVTLSTTGAIHAPATVTVLAGLKLVSFTVTSDDVGVNETDTITGTITYSKSDSILVTA